MKLVIFDQYGVVHDSENGCTEVIRFPLWQKRNYVTAKQVLVFGLPRCVGCFPTRHGFNRAIGRYVP